MTGAEADEIRPVIDGQRVRALALLKGRALGGADEDLASSSLFLLVGVQSFWLEFLEVANFEAVRRQLEASEKAIAHLEAGLARTAS